MYHCHDLEAPVIQCFETEKERATAILAASGNLRALAVTYVLWYEHSNYRGASFSASGAVTNLGSLGWSNRISSFKSTNGGRPKWWDGTSYSGTPWQWATSVWVSYVGADANDRFSSVQNVP